jgi:hypothetical protein
VTQGSSLITLFVAPLNRGRVNYVVTGGLASVLYGHPRLTLDIDLVIQLEASDAEHFASLWPEDEFYCPPVEVIREEGARRTFGHFNITHRESGMRADVYLAGNDDLQRWALDHSVAMKLEGETVQVAPIEYVIAFKLRYAREGGSDRHIRDVARVLQVNQDLIDLNVLHRFIERLGVTAEWERALVLSRQED